MATERSSRTQRRATGALFMIGAGVRHRGDDLAVTFDWPDILRKPAVLVLTMFAADGANLVWTWLAAALTYAILAVPILLLPTALGLRDNAVRERSCREEDVKI